VSETAGRIMIVEDREQILSIVEELLRSEGYDVVFTTNSGIEAIRGYKEKRPDLVLMDLILPDITGIEATRRILREDPEARIIAVTALSREGIVNECMKAGCKGFLLKPFRMRELMRSINEVLAEGTPAE
jgi:two-component system, chemotaxis family, chemotaxis protein CheY